MGKRSASSIKWWASPGAPGSLPDAENLAAQDPVQFQWWALGLVAARPVEQKQGADRGIDGRMYFHDEHNAKSATKQIVISAEVARVESSNNHPACFCPCFICSHSSGVNRTSRAWLPL